MSLAYDIAVALSPNGKPEKNKDGYVCCCPSHGDKNPSMSIVDNGKGGVICHCQVGCDWRDIKKALVEQKLLPEWTPDKVKAPKIEKKEPEKEEKESFLWKKAEKNDADISKYLQNRAITIPVPLCMKWGTYKKDDAIDHMVICAASKPTDKKVYAVQRLFIDIEEHKKVGAKMLGPCGEGRGVWFDRKGDVSEVVVGEGVETVLSAIQATKKNGVAALSTAGMDNLIFPDETMTIYILVDSDPVRDLENKSVVGQKAAVKLAKRFECSVEGRVAYLVSPDDTCFSDNPTKLDFNDLLKTDPTGQTIRDSFAKAVSFADLVWERKDVLVAAGNADEYTEMFERFVFLSSENKVIDTIGHDIKDSMMIERAFRISQAGKFHYYTDKEGKEKCILLAEHWLMSDEKKTASSLVYRPGERLLLTNGDGRTHYNTFRFPYQTAPEMVETEKEDRLRIWKVIMGCVFHRHVDYIEDWFSFAIQHPETRSGIMPICISKVGLGKSLIMAIIGKVVGQHNFSNAKILDVTGLSRSGNQWGDWIFNKKISCIEEIYPDGESGIRYKILDALKDIITNETLALNLKGGRNGTFPVYSNIMGFSNHTDCIKIPLDDRRLFICDSTDQRLLSSTEYTSIWAWMKDYKNIIAVYQYLARRTIGEDFIPGQAKMTTAKKMMQIDGRSQMQMAFDIVREQYPCDLATVGELRKAVRQAMSFIGADDDDNVMASKNGQYNAIMKNETLLVADGQRFRVKRIGEEESKASLVRCIRNKEKWRKAEDKEIKQEMLIKIPLFWIKDDEKAPINVGQFSEFSGQF